MVAFGVSRQTRATACRRRLRDHRLLKVLPKRGLDVAYREGAQKRADDERLERVGAADALAEDLDSSRDAKGSCLINVMV